MRITLILIASINPLLLKSQDLILPKAYRYEPVYSYWENENIDEMISYHKSGKKQCQYVVKNNALYKIIYNEDGSLIMEYEVEIVHKVDSIPYYDPVFYTKKVDVKAGYTDVLIGNYYEYSSLSELDTLTVGQYENDKRVGVWKSKSGPARELVYSTFNRSGELEGDFIVYRISHCIRKEIIWMKGKFGIVQRIRFFDGKKILTSQMIGIWTEFDCFENVARTINFDWR